jgi:hypothetical protein
MKLLPIEMTDQMTEMSQPSEFLKRNKLEHMRKFFNIQNVELGFFLQTPAISISLRYFLCEYMFIFIAIIFQCIKEKKKYCYILRETNHWYTNKYHFTPTKLAKVSHLVNAKCWQRCGDIGIAVLG